MKDRKMKNTKSNIVITNIRWYDDSSNKVLSPNDAYVKLGTPQTVLLTYTPRSADTDKEISELLRENYSYQAISFDKRSYGDRAFMNLQFEAALQINNDCCVAQITPTMAILED